MFVPGVNGSVIPSAPSSSKLKGAYKNSKKRKMPNGGSTGIGLALDMASYIPGPVGMYASGASTLSNLYQGDYVGAGLDALNVITGGTAKGLMGVARAAHAVRPYSNLALNAAQASRGVNKVARVTSPATRVAGSVNEVIGSNATMRVPQRDNAQVKPFIKPKMPYGGSIQSISPFGDVDASYGVGKNKLSAKVDGSVNILGKTLNNITPSVSYNNKGFNASVSPTNINANYNTDRLNLTGNVDMRDRSFSGANISGSYQVNPNLSFSGNYGVQKTPNGLDKNYFAGFRYSKAFDKGGVTNWKPAAPKPYVRTSPAGNSGYTDNTYVKPGVIDRSKIEANKKKLASMPPPPKPKVTPQAVKKPATVYKKPYTPVQDNRVYSDNTSVYSKPFVSNEKKGQFKAEEDFRQANEPAKGLILDMLPTPAASFARGAIGIDNRTGNFTEDQKKALAYAIAKAEIAKRGTNEEGYTGSFGYDDYPDKRVGFNALHNIREDDGRFDERVENIKKTWPTLTTQTTLGRASFKKHDKDNYLIHDKYNFDEQAKKPESIMEKGEVLGRKLGIETETNIVIPNTYVEEARKRISKEGSEPSVKPAVKPEPKPEPKTIVKPSVGKSTKQPVQQPTQQPRLKQSYEQSKTVPAQKVIKEQPTATKSSSSTQLTGERLKVQNYQKMLNEKYGANLKTDGAWGPKTQAAYEKYVQG